MSKETIQNCWRKTEITNNEEDISQVIAAIIEEEKKVEEELAVDFSKINSNLNTLQKSTLMSMQM